MSASSKAIKEAKRHLEKEGLYVVSSSEFERVADAYAESYAEYPPQVWFAGGQQNPKATKLLTLALLKAAKKQMLIIADSPKLDCIAIFLAPGAEPESNMSLSIAGMGKAFKAYGEGSEERIKSYREYGIRKKRNHIKNTDWFFFGLATRPERRGYGLASKIMVPMLELLDEQGVRAYLEVNTESNASMYRHYGFEIVVDGKIPGTDIIHYGMLRKPQKVARFKF